MSVSQSPSQVSAVDRAPAVDPHAAERSRVRATTFFGDYRRRAGEIGRAHV